MDPSEFIGLFSGLGRILGEFVHSPGTLETGMAETLEKALIRAEEKNPWFTRKNIRYALEAWSMELIPERIAQWIEPYRNDLDKKGRSLTIGVVMAGNIPLVGFHDFLCVICSGHKFIGRLSHKDAVLLPALAQILESMSPELESRIMFTEEVMTGHEAVIATGSTNTSHYFEYYFEKYPHIIRKNRKSLAVITGKEKPEELEKLGKDIFLYFGMGCRNVSRVFLPEGYDPGILLDALTGFSEVKDHVKYRNNYDYQRSVMLASGIPFFDNGYLLMTASGRLSSPLAVLQYDFYDHPGNLERTLKNMEDEVQCIVGIEKMPYRWCLPGETQNPRLQDYADGVDTLQFLLSLK